MRPISRRFLTSSQLLDLAACYAQEPGTVLLHSSGSVELSARSYLALFPVEILEGGAERGAWERIRERMGPPGEGQLPRWLGYIGYEMAGVMESDWGVCYSRGRFPDYYLVRPSVLIEWEVATGKATLWGEGEAEWPEGTPTQGVVRSDSLFWSVSQSRYLEQIRAVQESIRCGDLYQMCLSHDFYVQGEFDPFVLYRRLIAQGAAPYSAYLRLRQGSLLSSSPELFLRCDASGRLETRPIKGTAARGQSSIEDEQRRRELMQSDKESAELMMITDLMRNDLGRIAQIGSVEVTALRQCADFSHLFHTYSAIEAQARSDLHPVERVQRCFPPGSVTGCPKLRALEMIHLLEQRHRGPYTGAIGYFSGSQAFEWSVAIRVAELCEGEVRCQLGGAVTIDSDPKAEYEETLTKGRALMAALGL